MTMKRLAVGATAALALSLPAAAQAAVVITAASAVVEVGGEAGEAFAITNVIDQSGLSSGYESGVTDYDAFLAEDPLHSASGSYREWFSDLGANFARVTFDFGSVFKLSSLALWNEDAGGIGNLKIYALDKLIAEVSPLDTTGGVRFYGAQRFDFSEVETQFLTFEMSGCPQGGGAYNGCSMGEVVFGGAAAGAVPEPATWAMMILGFFGLGAVMRRRKPFAGAYASVGAQGGQ